MLPFHSGQRLQIIFLAKYQEAPSTLTCFPSGVFSVHTDTKYDSIPFSSKTVENEGRQCK